MHFYGQMEDTIFKYIQFYFQAEKELYDGWKMMKMERNALDLKTYIKQNLPENSTIGVDLNFYSICIINYLSTLAAFNILNDFL